MILRRKNPNYSEINLNVSIFTINPRWVGLDRSLGIATHCGLDGPEVNPDGGEIFCTGSHSGSYKMGTGSISRG